MISCMQYHLISSHLISSHLIHPSIHLLDPVTPFPTTPQSRSRQHSPHTTINQHTHTPWPWIWYHQCIIISSHQSVHLLNQVIPLSPAPQSRFTQHTHNNQLTYSHPLALDMISSMHYHLITSIHPPTQPSQPLVTNPTIQIHTTHTQQSTNILTPLGLGYDIIHALSSHLIHLSTSSTKSPRWHQPHSPDPHITHTTIN